MMIERTFEELGILIDGCEYGFFTVTATWDVWGSLSHIDIEPNAATGRVLTLDRRTLFPGHSRPGEVMYPSLPQTLFAAFEASIENAMTEDRELWALRQRAEGQVA